MRSLDPEPILSYVRRQLADTSEPVSSWGAVARYIGKPPRQVIRWAAGSQIQFRVADQICTDHLEVTVEELWPDAL